MAEALLVADGLGMRFGGLAAVTDVSITLERGVLHAVLGPNGAGKSTLLNLLSGELRPTAGSIRLGDRDVTRLPPQRRSRLGIGRSFQQTNVFPAFTAFENCRLAAQSRRPRAWRVFSDALADETVAAGARCTRSSGRTGRGSPPSSTCSPETSPPPPGACSTRGAT